MGVVVTLKFKMAVSSSRNGALVKVRSIWPILKLKQNARATTRRGLATSFHLGEVRPYNGLIGDNVQLPQ